MIIDFHTHIFPDSIAERTIEKLATAACVVPYFDGKKEGLLRKMEEAGVDISVNLPAMTKPGQFDSVNAFAKSINSEYEKERRRIISFAGFHPDESEVEEKMAFLKEEGFLGIKIHPEYQGTFIDDEKYVRIVKSAMDNDLVVVTHAGFDGAFTDTETRCTPKRAVRLIEKTGYKKLVFAHLGGNKMWDEVLEELSGEDVYLDTSFALNLVRRDLLLKIIEKKGADKILFATDGPWQDAKEYIGIMKNLPISEEDKQKIFSQNAIKLLKL